MLIGEGSDIKSSYMAEIIDTWEMTITPVEGVLSGTSTVELPAKPGMP